MDHKVWVEVPLVAGTERFRRIIDRLAGIGIECRLEEIPGLNSLEARGPAEFRGVCKDVLYVAREDVQRAAKVLRNALGIVDPRGLRPLTGKCPACGTPAHESWECPACELVLRAPRDENDPIVAFVLEHGGFEEP